MVIFFGTAFYGRIATHNDQWIETKFVHLFFVPLFPVGSMICTEWGFKSRKGWETDMNSKSVIATYCRLVTAAVALGLFYAGASMYGSDAWPFYLFGAVFAAAWVYFLLFFGKSTPEDLSIRDKLGALTGLYVLPHWLDHYHTHMLLDRFLARYKTLYPEADWKADLQSSHIPTEKRPLLYGLALFNCMAYDLPENDALYHIADRIYSLNDPAQTPPVVALQ